MSDIVKADYFEASTNQSLSFYFHACGDTKSLPNFGDNVTDDCRNEGYSLCMLVVDPPVNGTVQKKTIVLGKIDKMDFKNNKLMFPYDQSETNNKIATVDLQCTPDSDDTNLFAPLNIQRNEVVSNLR